MKKTNFLLLGAAGLLLASCSQEEIYTPGNGDGVSTISLNIGLPEMQTRAFSDGTTATKLWVGVYEELADNKIKYLEKQEISDFNKQATVTLQLIKDHSYSVVVWAASPNASSVYTINWDQDAVDTANPTMTVDYSNVEANDENLDAFFAYKSLGSVTGDSKIEVKLLRPFAQINVGTSDFEAAASKGYTVETSYIKVKGADDTLDLLTGNTSKTENTGSENTEIEITFKDSDIPASAAGPYPVNGYEYLAMAYVLVPSERSTADITFAYKGEDELESHEISVGSVPVQQNHRTNIFGQILTTQTDLEVEINDAFLGEFDKADPDLTEVHDGVKLDEASQTFFISNAVGLKWVADQVNRTNLDNHVAIQEYTYGAKQVAFVDQTIQLSSNVDLKDISWEPIGYETKDNGASVKAFAGIFNGAGYTISNLTVTTETNSNAGLFGATNRATIKNLTLKNINIQGHYKTGALVGDGYNVRIENCHIIGGKVISTPWEKDGKYDDANNVGGIVGYLNGQPEDAYVKNCSVDGLEITAFRKIGGIAGVATTADDANPHTSSVEISNCTVRNTVITADMTEKKYDGYDKRTPDIGKIVGTQTSDRTTIENNTAGEDVITKVILGDSDTLIANVLKSAKDGDNISLPEGIYGPFSFKEAKDFTSKNVIIDANGAEFIGANQLCFDETTIIKNAKINTTIVENLFISGNFEDCIFEGENGSGLYNAYTRSDVSFTRCKFIAEGNNGHRAFMLGENHNKAYMIDCEMKGYCPINGTMDLYFENCKFFTNTNGYGGIGVRGPAILKNCEFTLTGPHYDHNEIAVKALEGPFYFQNCKVNGKILNPSEEYFTVDIEGTVVNIDGNEITLSATTKKDENPKGLK